MGIEHSHLSDQQLLLAMDGELSRREAEHVQSHLAACWACRARKQELEGAIATFVRAHQQGTVLPPADGARALLKAHLAESAAVDSQGRFGLRGFGLRGFGWSQFGWTKPGAIAAVVLLTLAGSLALWRNRPVDRPVVVPNTQLTPGATVAVDRRQVCAESNEKNRAVPVALQRRVFEEYGIAGAEPRSYEVDYLITPALGGADDIHNLWPQSYSATQWNARVKDTLEDHLREMVCEGQLDLATAQREIASDWIGAYRKYLGTEVPGRADR